MLDLIIIGAGPSGLYAGYLAGLRELKGCVLESLPKAGGQLKTYYPEKPIYDIPGIPSIQADTFIDHLIQQYQPMVPNVPLHLQTQIVSLTRGEGFFNAVDQRGQTFQTQTVLLATGAGSLQPRKLEGYEHPRIVYTPGDLARYRGQKVAVLGGGDSALDWANALLGAGADVSLIHRRDEFRAMASLVRQFQQRGTLLVPYEVKSIDFSPSRLNLHLVNALTAEAIARTFDYVLVCYGFVSDTSLLQRWGLETFQGKAKVKSTMETSVPGIYAVGNAVTYDGKAHTIASAFGEVNTAIEAIHHRLHPNQKLLYSSFLKRN